MRFQRLLRHSLKARVTLLTLLIFVLSIGLLTWYGSRMLQNDLYRMLAAHQTETVALLTEQLGQEMDDRRRALEQVAASLPAVRGRNAALELQRLMRNNALLQDHFNSGAFVTDTQGDAIADNDAQERRIGMSYRDRDYVMQVLQHGVAVLGQPAIGRLQKAPIFAMAAPIKDAQGQVTGVLVGITDLGRSNLHDNALHRHFRKAGEYLVVDRAHQVVVTSSRPDHSLVPLASLGAEGLVERLRHGDEGSALYADASGADMLATVQNLPGAPWAVVGILPAAEAFAPARALRQRMLLSAAAMALAASVLTWWMLRRQLSPLLDAAHRLSALGVTEHTPELLPIARQDEVGDLITAFNRLLQRRAQDERALKDSEERFRLGFENANIGMCQVDLQGRITRVNWQLCKILGYSKAELESMNVDDVAHPDYAQVSSTFIRAAECGEGDHLEFEKVYLHKQGHAVRGYVSSSMVRDSEGNPLGFITHVMDITARKQAEEKLRLAASVFTHAREGIMITNRSGDIIDVNTSFTQITGYGRDEVLGRNPRLLSSGRQDAAFYAQLWSTLRDQDYWSGEIWNRRKDGQVFAEFLAISTVRNSQNGVSHYVALFSDITERKVMDEQVRQFAFYDALTSLPNRRLLRDRLQQARALSERYGHYGALMFLDLDNFKSLNDRDGHLAGDLLLVEVAERLKRCVRGVDTVARIGGDEFVVLLNELSHDRAASESLALTVAEKIRVALAEPYYLRPQRDDGADAVVEHHCSASIGCVLFFRDESSPDEILQSADAAMYQAKAQGRNRVHMHRA
jgi:diguanylate cyclase (GGDEF)-like protein/PAS domain S-box-containing protein